MAAHTITMLRITYWINPAIPPLARVPFFFVASLSFIGFLSRQFVSSWIESALISPCLNIVSSMTSISDLNSGKSAYLLRQALNSSNACCSSSAFSDSVMISSPPIVIALLIFPTLLFQLVFQSRLLLGANYLPGFLRPSLRCGRLRYFVCDCEQPVVFVLHQRFIECYQPMIAHRSTSPSISSIAPRPGFISPALLSSSRLCQAAPWFLVDHLGHELTHLLAGNSTSHISSLRRGNLCFPFARC